MKEDYNYDKNKICINQINNFNKKNDENIQNDN
jgi:hypothetical protein